MVKNPNRLGRPVFPEGWKTQFGLPFREHQKSMQVDIFEGYAIYGLRDNITANTVKCADEPASGNEDK